MTTVDATTAQAEREPSAWVVRFAPLIAASGAVLDVACGRGRHARWLAGRGLRVTVIDRDREALDACGAHEAIHADLEADEAGWPLAGRVFDAVIVTNYLHRPLFPALLGALSPGGVLLYETFAIGNARFGKPANPDFLLEPGELLRRVAGLDVVAFEDGLVDVPRPASVQRLCAIRPGGDRSTGPARHALSP